MSVIYIWADGEDNITGKSSIRQSDSQIRVDLSDADDVAQWQDKINTYLDIGTPYSDAVNWVKHELKGADIQILYHQDSDTRKVATLTEWRQYRKDLRNYVKNGQIVGDRPTKPA